jgi:hypothetical protein
MNEQPNYGSQSSATSGGGGGQAGSLSFALRNANASFSNTPLGQPIAGCDLHWISVQLIRHPDLTVRPAWWPPPQLPPYDSEPYKANTTKGKDVGSLNGYGSARYDNIPAGTCQFHFDRFYEKIDQFFREKLHD